MQVSLEKKNKLKISIIWDIFQTEKIKGSAEREAALILEKGLLHQNPARVLSSSITLYCAYIN
jgi:hypothetical protein